MSLWDRLTDVKLLRQQIRILQEQLSMERQHVDLLERKIQNKMMEVDALRDQMEAGK